MGEQQHARVMMRVCENEAYLSLLLLSNSDITLSPTLLNVRGMRNMSKDTISTKLLAIGVPVNNTLRRHLRDSRRLQTQG